MMFSLGVLIVCLIILGMSYHVYRIEKKKLDYKRNEMSKLIREFLSDWRGGGR